MAHLTVDTLHQVLERKIPECKAHLLESHTNLEKVAEYCEANYHHAPDKRRALEETKDFTTQSLASVAYQINDLASNFLHLLDLQGDQLKNMEASISHLSQTVMIHKEKVARREIGVLTANKIFTRPAGVKNPGIIFPESNERPVKYIRKPIDYSLLDDIGHGVKAGPQQGMMHPRASTKQQMAGAPTTKPPTPPSMGQNVSRQNSNASAIYNDHPGMQTPTIYKGTSSGTLKRQSSNQSQYRTPQPPAVPSNYAPGHVAMMQGMQRTSHSPSTRSSTASHTSILRDPRVSIPHPSEPPPPPPGVMGPDALPPPPDDLIRSSVASMYDRDSPPPPPPPPLNFVDFSQNPGGMFPGGGGGVAGRMSQRVSQMPAASDPMNYRGYDGTYQTAGYALSGEEDMGGGPPVEFIEKVVAIYDYTKDKDDELSFTEGCVIYVMKKNDDGWWEGVSNGVTGLFPCNYVEACI